MGLMEYGFDRYWPLIIVFLGGWMFFATGERAQRTFGSWALPHPLADGAGDGAHDGCALPVAEHGCRRSGTYLASVVAGGGNREAVAEQRNVEWDTWGRCLRGRRVYRLCRLQFLRFHRRAQRNPPQGRRIMSSQGTPGQNVPNAGVPNSGVPNANAPRPGTPGYVAAGYGTPGGWSGPPPRRRRRSFSGPFVLIVLGIIFLLGNLHMLAWSRIGSLFAHYWPLLLILWGVVKLIEYQTAQREGYSPPGIGAGGIILVVGIVFLGLIATQAERFNWSGLRNQINIDDDDLNNIFGETYNFDDQLQRDFPAGGSLKIIDNHGAVSVHTSEDNKITVVVRKRVGADNRDDAANMTARPNRL